MGPEIRPSPGIYKRRAGWEARIICMGKSLLIGQFESSDAAIHARNAVLASFGMPAFWEETFADHATADLIALVNALGQGPAVASSRAKEESNLVPPTLLSILPVFTASQTASDGATHEHPRIVTNAKDSSCEATSHAACSSEASPVGVQASRTTEALSKQASCAKRHPAVSTAAWISQPLFAPPTQSATAGSAPFCRSGTRAHQPTGATNQQAHQQPNCAQPHLDPVNRRPSRQPPARPHDSCSASPPTASKTARKPRLPSELQPSSCSATRASPSQPQHGKQATTPPLRVSEPAIAIGATVTAALAAVASFVADRGANTAPAATPPQTAAGSTSTAAIAAGNAATGAAAAALPGLPIAPACKTGSHKHQPSASSRGEGEAGPALKSSPEIDARVSPEDARLLEGEPPTARCRLGTQGEALDWMRGEVERNAGKRDHGLPKGITRRRGSGKFECKLCVGGKRVYVGVFDGVEEALAAQRDKRRCIAEAAARPPPQRADGRSDVRHADEAAAGVERAEPAGVCAVGDRAAEVAAEAERVRGARRRRSGRWEAQLVLGKVRHYLGTFDTSEEALRARAAKMRQLGMLPSPPPSVQQAAAPS